MSNTKTMARFIADGANDKSFYKLVADQGENFKIIRSPLPLGEPGLCYTNAAQVALDSDEYDYCQGYATSPRVSIPLQHAWLVRKSDRAAFCVTWHDGMTECYGVVVNRETLRKHTVETEMWGITWHCDATDFELE